MAEVHMELHSKRSLALSLLCVEDDEDSRNATCQILSLKYPSLLVLRAENGAVGLEMFKEHGPDIVLTDIIMPEMDGIEMSRRIRELDPGANIIAATAFSETGYLLDAIKIGIKGYVQKPFVLDLLFEAIEDCMVRITAERQMRVQNDLIRKLSRAVEQSPNMLMITDVRGSIEYVNPRFTKVTGYAPGEVLGHNLRILLANGSPLDTVELIWNTITRGAEWHGELFARKKSGETYCQELSISPMTSEQGDITHFLAIMEDITQRKRMEQELKEGEIRYSRLNQELEQRVAERTLKLQRIGEELRDSRQQLRFFLDYQQRARDEERTAISREIHDELGQALATVQLGLSSLADEYRDHQVLADRFAVMDQLLYGGMQTVKKIAAQLRPPILDELGLAEAIEWHVSVFRKTAKIDCTLDILLPERSYGKDVATVVFRIFQEALTNAARHSGATRLSISLEERDGRIVLIVTDNGRGIKPEEVHSRQSLGLIGMRERAYALGGRVRVCRGRKQGTSVIARIPIGADTPGLIHRG